MALLICVECGGKVSSFAQACPHCGCPAEQQNKAECKEQNNQIFSEKASSGNGRTVVKAKELKNLSEWREIRNLLRSGNKPAAVELMISITNTNRSRCESFARKMERMIGLSAEAILQEFPDQVDTVDFVVESDKNIWTERISEQEKNDLMKRLAYTHRWENIVSRITQPVVTLSDKYIIEKEIAALINTNDTSDVNEIYRYIEHTGEIPYGTLAEKYPRQYLKQKTRPCSVCSRQISSKAETCPHCGQPTGVHVCPRCGSTNTYIISRADKAAMTFVFGRYAAHNIMSKYGCNDCNYAF